MLYSLIGFTHDLGARVFAFETVVPGGERTKFKVSADLALVRKHNIPVQELPLLCRSVLEVAGAETGQRAFTYTEDDMCRYEDILSARKAAAAHKKAARRPPANTSAPQTNNHA